ncbi:hypothetical protein [Serratia sp. DD3]|uniref:hypothetical protein n=1 Tax=Serratia sp. DD3 TaxID=1410619 RepID=UPI0003C4F1F2|nr:hypothetical protein [Serratia sp. DD3]KEY58865.1 hypothetical protein SRDD_22550 [Serratia sp. DD3]
MKFNIEFLDEINCIYSMDIEKITHKDFHEFIRKDISSNDTTLYVNNEQIKFTRDNISYIWDAFEPESVEVSFYSNDDVIILHESINNFLNDIFTFKGDVIIKFFFDVYREKTLGSFIKSTEIE